ncbi:MAG: DUF5706 domain-containing protein [Saprospiraceae bacterium]
MQEELPVFEIDYSLDFSKETINVIRTSLRNYIEMTAIVDNKANVLLSLSALMIAFVVPLALSNLDVIETYFLFIPLLLLATTCAATIYLSTLVLAPFDFEKFDEELPEGLEPSPFFFGAAYKRSLPDYYLYLKESTEKKGMVRKHLAYDLFFIGRRLGEKMTLMHQTFRVFRYGVFFTLLATAIVLMISL